MTTADLRKVPKPNVYLDFLLVSVLYFELGLILYKLSSDLEMLVVFGIAIVAVAVAVLVVKGSFRVGGRLLSKYLLSHLGDPLQKRKPMKKWCDQSWQLAIHTTMAIFEYDILRDVSWWADTESMWNPESGSQCSYAPQYKVKVLYVVQLGIWIYTAFSCKYFEEIRKDYLVMMTHHVVTIALVAGSYFPGFIPVGVVGLFLHDLSDIPLDLLKMANYAKLEGLKGLFLTEMLFALLLVDWFYFRIYLYPVKLLYPSSLQAKSICSPDTPIFEVGDDIPYWLLLNCLLFVLWLLHIWWGLLIVRLLVRTIAKGTHAAGEAEYEGGSSDSDSDSEKEKDD